MPFVNLNDLEEEKPLPGLKTKFIHGETMTVVYGDAEAGYTFRTEQHPNEQFILMEKGEFELTLGDEIKILKPGDIAVIPPNMPHSVRAITDCRTIEIFYPRSRRANPERAGEPGHCYTRQGFENG